MGLASGKNARGRGGGQRATASVPAGQDSSASSNAGVPGAAILEEMVFPARLESVIEVRDRVAELVRAWGLSGQGIDEVRLAVGEAFINAVRHGCRELAAKGPVEVRVRVLRSGGMAAVEVRDPGPGFDPDQVDVTMPGDMKPGGRGLFFMRLAMDEVSFEFKDGTLVRMTKRLTPAGGVGEAA